MKYLILVLVLAMCFISSSEDHWRMQVTWGLWCSLLLISNEVRKKTHWTAATLFLFCSSSAAYITFHPDSPFHGYGAAEVTFFAKSAQSLAWLVLIVITTIVIPKTKLTLWFESFCVAGMISASLMIVKYLCGMPPASIFDNPSMDATFLALTIPYIVYGLKKDKEVLAVMLIPSLVAIAISKSHTALAIMYFEGIIYIFLEYGKSLVSVVVGAFSLPIGFLVGKLLLGNKFGQSSGRTTVWKIILAQWAYLQHFWLGNGSGTFRPLTADAQAVNGITMSFPFAHNEPLQILFEQGVVGLMLIIALYSLMISGARIQSRWLTITVLGVGLASLTQPIFRYFPFALFCALICRMSLGAFSDETT